MEYRNFLLDGFQEEAVKELEAENSVIVSAPTGCGKTLIAEYTVDKAIKEGVGVVYTSPVKALSNQKYRDFKRRFGSDTVGIHTGDVSINPDAPLLIMTTEIFRNILLENSTRINKFGYAVFDEVHYLDDKERGAVWEESIILAPPHIRFVCLSATVPNIKQLAEWMSSIREESFSIITENVRPVPLEHNIFSAKYGPMRIKDVRKKYKKRLSERKKFLRRKPSSKRIISYVLKHAGSPVLYFCFNRKACEKNAETHSKNNFLTQQERDSVETIVEDLANRLSLKEYNKLEGLKNIWLSGCAFHHAGMLPAVKEIVERLFTEGLLKLLFCTETFALGINMPAKTVIFDELERFNGIDFQYLTTRQYMQMAGRAGRRGMDKKGYVYSLIIPEATSPQEIQRLFSGSSEKIKSRFYASYSSILTLYSRFGEQALNLFRKSLGNYGKGGELTSFYEKEETQIKNRIKFLQNTGFLDGKELTPKGELAARANGYEIQTAELYYSRSLDQCNPLHLCIVFAGLITEEKKRRMPPPAITFEFPGKKVVHKLKRKEKKFGIQNTIPEMNFALASAVYSWASGCSLSEITSFGVPEGDLVRVLRMTIQLMRTLAEIIDDTVTIEKLYQGIKLINRDVVDAQAELEASV